MTVIKQLKDSLTPAEKKIIAENEKLYLKGKGANWREAKLALAAKGRFFKSVKAAKKYIESL